MELSFWCKAMQRHLGFSVLDLVTVTSHLCPTLPPGACKTEIFKRKFLVSAQSPADSAGLTCQCLHLFNFLSCWARVWANASVHQVKLGIYYIFCDISSGQCPQNQVRSFPSNMKHAPGDCPHQTSHLLFL